MTIKPGIIFPKIAPTDLPLTRASVINAHSMIKQHVHRTPVLTCKTLDELASTSLPGENQESFQLRLFFKAENLQRIGAFKIRGATHALARLLDPSISPPEFIQHIRQAGVITHSSGNHAQALALAAQRAGIPCTVVMPSISTKTKIDATKGYGAHVVFSGSTAREREIVVAELQAKSGSVLVPPYDHPDIIVGQGTLALEFTQQVLELAGSEQYNLDAIITPCGGGGMLGGVATACQTTGIKVFGAEPQKDGADDCMRGLKVGKRITEVNTLTIADGLRTPVGLWNWKIISDTNMVDSVYSVSEEEILKAWRLVLERMKIVVEPSSAVPLAVVLYNTEFRQRVRTLWQEQGHANIGIVFSGGNVSVERIGELFRE